MLNLDKVRSETAPVQLAQNVLALHQAAIGAISNDDVAAIMQKMVSDAKNGDRKAAQFIFDYLGGKGSNIQINVDQRRNEQQEQPSLANGKTIVMPAEQAPPSVRDFCRLIGRYLTRNGPTPLDELAELFGFANRTQDVWDAINSLEPGCFTLSDQGDVLITELGRNQLKKGFK